jgi:quinol monooxygenase YgiN
MYVSIRRYRLDRGSMDDVLHLVDTDFAESIQEVDGFVGYEVVDGGNGELCTMSFFRDMDAAEASVQIAADWVRDTLSQRFDITRLDVFNGEVAVSRARREMLETAHH